MILWDSALLAEYVYIYIYIEIYKFKLDVKI